MNEHELRDLLPAERRLPAGRRQDMKERLMLQVEEAEKTERRRYRVATGAVAAAVLVAAGLVALLLGTGSGSDGDPDRGDVTDLAENPDVPEGGGLPDGTVEQVLANLGGRPILDAERIGCVAEGTEVIDAASAGNEQLSYNPLDQPLTREGLIRQCMHGGDWNGTDYTGLDVGEGVACVRPGGYGPAGNPGNDDFPLAVVALNDLSCEEAGSPETTVRPMTDADLAELERMREIEIMLLADPRPCPNRAQSQQWARSRLAEAGIDVEVTIDPTRTDSVPDGSCTWRPRVFWHASDSGPGVGTYGVSVVVTPLQQTTETAETTETP
jgi:hypothetical protein